VFQIGIIIVLVVLLVLLTVFLCCRFRRDACEVLLCCRFLCLVDSENRRRRHADQGRTEEIVDPEDELFKLGSVDSESEPRSASCVEDACFQPPDLLQTAILVLLPLHHIT